MPDHTGDLPSSRFLFPDAADFLTPVGRAINTSAVGGNASLLAME